MGEVSGRHEKTQHQYAQVEKVTEMEMEMPMCVEIVKIAGEEREALEQCPRLLNTGTFCCRSCGVFDLVGYRSRLTPQLAGIAEEETEFECYDEGDLMEEDAVLGVLRKAPVVECFNCALASDEEAAAAAVQESILTAADEEAEEEQMALDLEQEQQAALLMLGELRVGMELEDEEDEEDLAMATNEQELERFSEEDVERMLEGFYSQAHTEAEAEVDLVDVERKLSFMSSSGCDDDSQCDLDSMVASLKDLAESDVDEAETMRRGCTLYDCAESLSSASGVSARASEETECDAVGVEAKRLTVEEAELNNAKISASLVLALTLKEHQSNANNTVSKVLSINGEKTMARSLSDVSTRMDSTAGSFDSTSASECDPYSPTDSERVDIGYLRISSKTRSADTDGDQGQGQCFVSNYSRYLVVPTNTNY